MTAANAVSEEWRLQSVRDLAVSKLLASNGYFEWAVYAAQQATEKAIKSVRHVLAIDMADDNERSHKLIELSNPLRAVAPSMLPTNADLGRVTQHEADGRYPGVRTGPYRAPFQVYGPADAYHAILVAETLVSRCSRLTTVLQIHWANWAV